MLRGQASLQEIVGKGLSFKRKPPVKAEKSSKRSKLEYSATRGKQEKQSSTEASQPHALSKTQHDAVQSAPEPPSCPVCNRAISSLGEDIDTHIDGCLARAALGRSSAQKTVRESMQPAQAGQAKYRRKLSSAKPHISDSAEELKLGKQPLSPSCQSPASPRRSGFAKAASCSPQPRSLHFSLQTCIVGRRFRAAEAVTQGMHVRVQHDPLNQRDSNALVVITTDTCSTIGYLPAGVAAAIAPLVKEELVTTKASVSDLGRTPSAPVPLMLQVHAAPKSSPEALDRVAESIRQAEAASDARQAQNLARSGSGTGDILRTNFLLLVDTVMHHDGHLLAAEELQQLRTFKELASSAQALFLRLFQRTGPWFRQRSLDYSEVPAVPEAVEHLAQASLVHTLSASNADGLASAVEVLTVLELSSILAGAKLLPKKGSASLTKAGLVAIMRNALETEAAASIVEQQALQQSILQLTGPLVRLAPSALQLVHRLRRLFFLNEGQDFSRFLVTDLGITKYPSYKVSRHMPAFPDREALQQYELALQQATTLDAALEAADQDAVQAALEPALAAISAGAHKLTRQAADATSWVARVKKEAPFLLRYCAVWVYTAMCTPAVSMLEKQRQYQQATELLQQLLGGDCCVGRRGEWWVRLCLDTEHLGRPEQALEMAEAALADEWVRHGDRLDLQRRCLRLGKPPRRWRRPPWAKQALQDPKEVRIEAKPLANALGLKSRFLASAELGGEDQEVTVEQLALLHYGSPLGGGWTGMHCEGGIWGTLFGLLMWDILFMEVPGAFRTRFQSAPLDLSTPLFFPARHDAIEARLAEITGGSAPNLLRSRWDSSVGTLCTGVNWDRNTLDELVEIATCVGGSGLAAVCRLLAEDHAGWSGGMPDLLLWKPASQAAKLSEVKGPRDRLSEQQRAWITALSSAGLQVEVLKVVEPKAATMGLGSASRRR